MLYRVSAGLSLFEKYEIGHHSFPMRCWRTALTATSEASVMMFVGASGFGCESRLASAMASSTVAKATVAWSLQGRFFVLSLEVANN